MGGWLNLGQFGDSLLQTRERGNESALFLILVGRSGLRGGGGFGWTDEGDFVGLCDDGVCSGDLVVLCRFT